MDPQQVNLVDQHPSTLAKINLPQTSTQIVQQQSLPQPQLPQCSICRTTEKLLRCAKCKAIYYCSTEHQHLDWPTHKQQCRALAKQRQINNRLQQVTTSCGAININTHSNLNVAGSSNVSVNNWSYNINPAYDNNKLQSNTFMLGTHENEILNSKAETVTQSSSTREYVGSFDANSTTSDQMHLMVQNNLDYPLSQQSSHNFVYYQQESTEPRQCCSGVSSEATSSSSAALQPQIRTLPQQLNIPLQQSYMPQQQNAAIQFSVPQLSNHSINQYEKSSSYQIGAAVGNENLWENINERRYEELCRNIINDMNQYGLSVVDDFLGEEKGLQILKEVVQMHSHGVFKDGQLVNNTKSEQALRRIRGDKITWVKGVEPDCANVGYLINQIDAVICRANSMRNNGKLGNYVIKERTKAMVACYPGSGSHYVMHVDNPNKDGRVITAIYYLNLNWNSQSNGGVLRIFPDQSKSVADIEPKFDRLIFFWSDKRNPHEVQPAHRTRYAITVWYFDANEREQALSRCKTSQTTNNLRNVNSASSSQMNTSNSNIENKTTTDSKISVDSTSPSHVPSSSSSTSQPPLSSSQTLSNDNVDNPAADTATNKSPSPARPTQVVRPSICQ